MPDDLRHSAIDWSLRGFANDRNQLPQDLNLRVQTVIDTANRIAALNQEQNDLDGYYAYLNSKGVKGADGQPLVAPNLKQQVKSQPELIDHITGPWANHFGESPSAALKAMKDGTSAKGPIMNLYGGKQLLDKYDLLKDSEKKTSEAQAGADVEVNKERRLIPIKAETAGAEAAAKAKAVSASAKNEDGSWNLNSIPVSLVDGNMDPSQLSKRSQDYDAKLQQANEYSQQKYGKPFDIAKAQSDYKYATNPSTQNTLKYLNSLTGSDNKSGNLGALVSLSDKITRTDFPALNDAAAWAKLQTGNPQMASYYTAVTEVADQVAKILQGGGSGSGTSDAKLKQASELFNKGFSKDQITGVANTLRTLLGNRKTELVGDNRYLLKQYGQSSAAQQVSAPPASLLKEGVHTTFANGQTWTLQNGQPAQVNNASGQ